jgi:hypothetical protein
MPALRYALALLLPLCALAKPLFDFNEKPTLYSFKNDASTLTMSVVPESALPASKSLQVEYTVAGNMAFIGLGVGFHYLAPWMAKWEDFGAAGGLVLVAKSKEPTSLAIELKTEGGTYKTSLALTAEWQRFAVPFASLVDKDGKPYVPGTVKLQKLELRPGRKPATNTLWLDQLDLEENVTAATTPVPPAAAPAQP